MARWLIAVGTEGTMILRMMIVGLAFGVTMACAEQNPAFQTYVPPSYRSEKPAGLIVYVSPIKSGEVSDTWKSTLDRRNVIWVSVNESGNSMTSEQRISEATASLAFIDEKYILDDRGIYIAGMSGGAQIASVVAALRPDLFNGGLFFCGVDPWSERDVDPWIESPPEDFDTMKENRYVFVSGTEDFNLDW
jgi:pimeloyl-ACP methyl ester carboxylesterase